jgi:hypothetical protein
MEDIAQTMTNKTATAITNDFQGAKGTIEKGTLANRPAFGNTPRYYFATDEKKVYFDTGSAWVLIAQPAHKLVKGVFTISNSYQQVSADYDAIIAATYLLEATASLGTFTGESLDILICDSGTGDFIALGQTARNWYGMTTLGSDVYACVNGGDIYKQTGGTGNFIALGQTSRGWIGMTTLGSDVYASVNGGDIYKRANEYTAAQLENTDSGTIVIGVSLTTIIKHSVSILVPKGKYIKHVLTVGTPDLILSYKIELQPEV